MHGNWTYIKRPGNFLGGSGNEVKNSAIPECDAKLKYEWLTEVLTQWKKNVHWAQGQANRPELADSQAISSLQILELLPE